MMKFDFAWVCAASVFMLQSCSEEQATDIRQQADRELTFSSMIENIGPASRAANNRWDKNDCIGVYIFTSDAQTAITENRSFTTAAGDGNFSSTTGSMIYPEQTVDYKAYYPYNEGITDYIYKVSVADQSQPEKIDLLYADNLTGREPSSTTGNLQFKHKLARLRLNLSSTDNSDISSLQASVTGVQAATEFNLKTGTFATATTSTASIAMKMDVNSASALLIPAASTSGIKIQLTLGGKTKEVSLPATFTSFEGGNDYVVNLNIKNGGSTLVPEAAKYFKRTETPVITDEQLETYKYITNFCPDDKNVRNYSMLYDTSLKMAYWVAYPLCNYYTQKNTDRTNNWGYDPNLSSSLQANMAKGLNGYDRGHQIPSADRLRSAALNTTTFYYTNMTPQVSKMNQQIWANLEGKVRDWTSGTDTVFVVTGAMPTTTTDKNITYTSDNSGKQIAVPKYYFKALARKLSGTFYTIAFKIENREGYDSNGYMNCALSVSDLEKETGFTFFPSIDASAKATLDKSKWN